MGCLAFIVSIVRCIRRLGAWGKPCKVDAPDKRGDEANDRSNSLAAWLACKLCEALPAALGSRRVKGQM